MTELSFLIDLLLNHELQKPTKDAIAVRIIEVEAQITCPAVARVLSSASQITATSLPYPSGVRQVQSTLDAMARHGEIGHTAPIIHPQQLPPEMPPIPVEHIAQTQAAAQAMNSRNQAIAESIAGKIDKVTGRPRKF